jgi:manganese-dependent inorganic pyrophosphatase
MSLPEIIVTGHRNPDTDAATSAVCYADFKGKTDPTHRYRGVVCGALNPQTRFVFEKAGLPQPELLKDVFPRVIDVARNDGLNLDENAPVLEAIREIDENTVSVVPVFNDHQDFLGIIGVHEVASYFIKSSGEGHSQNYLFHIDNLVKVIPGELVHRGRLAEVSAPILIGAQDDDRAVERVDEEKDSHPVLVVGRRKHVIEQAIRNQYSIIIIPNTRVLPKLDVDLSRFEGTIYLSHINTADTVRMLWLSAPVKHIMNPAPQVLDHDLVFDEAKRILLGSDLRGIPVVKDGVFAGVVTRRSFIEKPRKKIIMIDHNESAQSIAGAFDADVLEIIDHHRLAAEKTTAPIYVFSKPLGSSCTIVYQHYKMYDIPIETPYAVLMLSGILSDTLFLRSPTTTDDDRVAAADLADIAGLEIPEYAKEILAKMTTLENLDPVKTASGDFKIYQDFGVSAGIAQVEIVSLDGVEAVLPQFLDALEQVKKENSLDWSMLLVTDVVNEDSVLMTTPFHKAEEHLAFPKLRDNLYHLPGVVSRKKQLLPEILRVLEAAQS